MLLFPSLDMRLHPVLGIPDILSVSQDKKRFLKVPYDFLGKERLTCAGFSIHNHDVTIVRTQCIPYLRR
jgi:hypothetical protein